MPQDRSAAPQHTPWRAPDAGHPPAPAPRRAGRSRWRANSRRAARQDQWGPRASIRRPVGATPTRRRVRRHCQKFCPRAGRTMNSSTSSVLNVRVCTTHRSAAQMACARRMTARRLRRPVYVPHRRRPAEPAPRAGLRGAPSWRSRWACAGSSAWSSTDPPPPGVRTRSLRPPVGVDAPDGPTTRTRRSPPTPPASC